MSRSHVDAGAGSAAIVASSAKTNDAGVPAARLLLLALVAGAVAGMASWGVGEATVGRFVPSLLVSRAEFKTQDEQVAEMLRLVHRRDTIRAMFAYGALGGFLGLALGLIGGLAQRSVGLAVSAAAIGLLVGGAAGAGTTFGLLPSYFAAERASGDHFSSDITTPLLFHAAIWTAAGLAAGLALGLGLGGWRRAFQAGVGGALGAVLGTFVYEVIGPFAFPNAATSEPFATERLARLMAHLSIALLVALGAAWSARYLSAKGKPKVVQAG
jgi:hypothetical protein